MRHGKMRVAGPIAYLLMAGALCSCSRQAPPEAAPTPAAAAPAAAGAAHTSAGPGPWRRTEQRQPCANFNLLRNPYFGDVHVHTTYSFDAVSGDVRTHPLDAYNFARGKPIPLPPYDAQGRPLRTAELARPLDFTAVTDHSEFFGETSLCLDPKAAAYNDPTCVTFRAAIPQMTEASSLGIQAFGGPYIGLWDPKTSTRFKFCYPNNDPKAPGGPQICLERASAIWTDIQQAAAQAYDTTAACAFSSFIAYEWTASPMGQNLHRNVIFRNDAVPPLPISSVDQSTPQGLWASLESQCLDPHVLQGRCDVLAIPHNSNLSNGLMFAGIEDATGHPLLSAQDAAFRAAMEPLVEVVQHKGDSECKPGVGGTLANDESCGFEKWTSPFLGVVPAGTPQFAPLLYVRNALKLGLAVEQKTGVNPLRVGLIGSTDTHNSTPGHVREDDYQGHLGSRDATPANMVVPLVTGVIGGIESNPGGLAVVWAEENSRDALFAAMRRRETYSTSGTRPIVRFFGGALSGVTCGAADFVARAYQTGVPMGGELGMAAESPRFAVLALQDPGEDASHPGTPLQHIQIVKGWIDAAGQPQEQVFEVAGAANDGSTVDTHSCVATSKGARSLCAVWQDPAFEPSQRAFYYARVIEDPVCRWSTRLCNAQGVDCGKPESVAKEFATCCDPQYAKTIHERALTSPIWYRPEGLGTLTGTIQFGATPGQDVLMLKATLGKLPAGVDLKTQDVVLALRDDDSIYTVTVPAGRLQLAAPGRYEYADAGGGLKHFVWGVDAGTLEVQTVPTTLSRADRSTHTVEFRLRVGAYQTAHSRQWVYTSTPKGSSLSTT
jgi:hypothetical protein